ncbi:restriction endonuclease subunit S [Acinetobacter towneri]|uniref:restriction endonuclease subunit S n=1 Tax=Acinetobacter towneri TaxID=202956 RepID=UPI0025764E6C|nr:restriction endonuclease subunit S [Acinetobacter towneri]MDM1753780.1 restriction endonuclease subunit S [Acinetobacter towneri]
MAKYQKYAEYKDSGVEWLGEIPNDWINTKVKYEAYVKARVGWHGLKSDDFTDEGPYLVTGSDFKGTNIDWSQCYHCDLPRYEQDPYIQLKDGDLLITKDGTIGKVALVSNLKDDEKATLNSGIFVVRPLRNNFSTKFYFWLLQSKVFKEFVDFNKTGSTIVHLYQDTFVNFEYASPVLEDQIKISNFLDHETIKIDHLIEKQQQLIELLKEKRQAVISHAVTKGLDPNVPMKDSGVAWLGEVPEHWKVSALGYYSNLNTGATPDRSNSNYWEGYIPWIKTGEVKYDTIFTAEELITDLALKQTSVQLSPPGTLLMAMYGQGITRGRVALLGVSATYNQACVAINTNSKVWNEYLKLFFMAAYHAIRDGGNETSQMNLNADIVKKFKITIPTIDEQHQIVESINNEIPKIDSLIVKAESAIQLMQERRTALISAVVTGKIDVRNWQAPTLAEADMELSA